MPEKYMSLMLFLFFFISIYAIWLNLQFNHKF